MIDLSSLKLPAGSAAEIEWPDGHLWHAQAWGDDCIWLTSPALPKPHGDAHQCLDILESMLAHQALGVEPAGCRLVRTEAGDLVLQACWSPAVPVEAFWSSLLETESAWAKALAEGVGRAGLTEPAQGTALSEAAQADIFDSLMAAIGGDHELESLATVDRDQRTIAFECPGETWVMGLLCGPMPHQATLVQPIRVVPADPAAAQALVLQALTTNAGWRLGPNAVLSLDASDPELASLVLLTRLDMQGLQPGDLQAAMGRLLRMSEEILAEWDVDGDGDGGEGSSMRDAAAADALMSAGHPSRFTNIKG